MSDEPKIIKDFPGRAVEAFRNRHGGALPRELDLCPHCGFDEASYNKERHLHFVVCLHCGSRSPATATQAGARTVWNARATRPEAGATIDKEAEARALKAFEEYFLKNYQPNCVLYRPAWHAPKIFRAALYAIYKCPQPPQKPEAEAQFPFVAVGLVKGNGEFTVYERPIPDGEHIVYIAAKGQAGSPKEPQPPQPGGNQQDGAA